MDKHHWAVRGMLLALRQTKQVAEHHLEAAVGLIGRTISGCGSTVQATCSLHDRADGCQQHVGACDE